ncbi:hypothetical protein AAG570_011056 [Ranatra chinensis]|uniref:Chitin-binding type-2 domain-containing protein n=1 Tax=Ranatra chinensis TaxID=642074 RepID=A0ABD0YJS4_9HEMI
MASKRRNMFYLNNKQETREICTCNLPSFRDPRGAGLVLALALCFCGSLGANLKCSKPGARYPSPDDCSKFAECSKEGLLDIKSCGVLERFDAKTKTCAKSWATACTTVQCLEGDRKPVAGDCKKYRYCEGGVWKDGSCHFWYRFDPAQKACRSSYDCKASPQCDKEGATRATMAKDCMVYWQCKNSMWVAASCYLGHYNVKTNECDRSVVCECKDGERKPVIGLCQKYMDCVQGRFQPKRCSFGHRYHEKSKKCVWWFNVKC